MRAGAVRVAALTGGHAFARGRSCWRQPCSQLQPGAIPTLSPTPAAEDGLIDYAGKLQYGGVDCLRQFSATLAAITRCPTTSKALAMLTASTADNAQVSKGAGVAGDALGRLLAAACNSQP